MAIQYQVYLRQQGDNWTHLGNTVDTEWDISGYDFDYFTIYQWRVDTYDTETELTTTGDTWTFTSQRSSAFASERRSDFDPDLIWSETSEAWYNPNVVDFAVAGGGRYKARLIAVGHNSVYFGDSQ